MNMEETLRKYKSVWTKKEQASWLDPRFISSNRIDLVERLSKIRLEKLKLQKSFIKDIESTYNIKVPLKYCKNIYKHFKGRLYLLKVNQKVYRTAWFQYLLTVKIIKLKGATLSFYDFLKGDRVHNAFAVYIFTENIVGRITLQEYNLERKEFFKKEALKTKNTLQQMFGDF